MFAFSCLLCILLYVCGGSLLAYDYIINKYLILLTYQWGFLHSHILACNTARCKHQLQFVTNGLDYLKLQFNSGLFLPPAKWHGSVFGGICKSVCLSVRMWYNNFWKPCCRKFIFGLWVKVTSWKYADQIHVWWSLGLEQGHSQSVNQSINQII